MSKAIYVNEESYKKLQAALLLTGEDESSVLNSLIINYAHSVFENTLGESSLSKQGSESNSTVLTESEQKIRFTNWFRSLTRNGKPYNPVTISGYTGRIENACADPIFRSVPVNNLFTITDLAEYLQIQRQIKACAGYTEFDARSHNGFTAALRKYEEFLRYQADGTTADTPPAAPYIYQLSASVHRWTMAEDFICCKRFLEYYVIQKSDMDVASFLKMLVKEVPDITEGSLRMKIQNIKYLATREGLKDTFPLSWLSQYSMQCERAFKEALRELNIV